MDSLDTLCRFASFAHFLRADLVRIRNCRVLGRHFDTFVCAYLSVHAHTGLCTSAHMHTVVESCKSVNVCMPVHASVS